MVPEGFFWRVADHKDYGDPHVYLMERKLATVRKMRTFLGLDLGFKYVKEMGDVVEARRGFNGSTKDPTGAPAGAVSNGVVHTASGILYRYAEPVNEKTIADRAIDIMKCRLRQEQQEKERERAKVERDALKEKFYGDYPPKTLVH